MEQTFVFVYAKKSEIKVLNLEGSRNEHALLINSGWIHTATLDACKWIQNIHNGTYDVECEVKSLSGINKTDNWIMLDDEKPNYREWVTVITTNSDVPITACFDSIRDKWYFYDFSDNEWYEFATVVNVIKWRYCFHS